MKFAAMLFIIDTMPFIMDPFIDKQYRQWYNASLLTENTNRKEDYMTFYQELQLNQAGSKAVIKSASGSREKLHHTCIYMCKIAITMIFCMCFVMLYGKVFGDENSIVGVVVLLHLMVFKNADFGICMRHSLEVLGIVFGIMMIGPRAANLFGPFGGMFINIGCIFTLVFLSCHNILMSNHSTIVLGYLLLYGYDVNSAAAFSLRLLGLLIGGILTAVVFYRGHKNRTYKRDLHSIFKEFHIHSSRTKWQIAMTFGIATMMFFVEILNLPRAMWVGIAVMSVMLPFETDSKNRSQGRIPGNIFGGILFLVLYLLLPPSFLSYAGIIGGIGVGLSATYGWQSVFNSLGAMAVATGVIGLEGAILFRIVHNVCGSIYGQVFYKWFYRLTGMLIKERKESVTP